MNQLAKLALEAGPLVVFFVANATTTLVTATAVFVAATVVSLVLSWLVLRKVPVMPLVGGVFVVIFGGLTVFLGDELFIKIKPTVVNLLFATLLVAGLATGRLFLKLALGTAFALSDEGWRRLTWRWVFFFVVLAALNEVVWRSFDSDTWVAFKVWGIMPLTLVFSLLQLPLINRYQTTEESV
ncbi:septation protein A [Pararhodospirillum photometricum]|uniref:Inner membrane-spanning protein YciB n=1 Tax=Pararhodospirillum photometricum DSM 122 TaxID=1150469 RepID=H6SSM1_PARPM|nr:septation protein A [Pararhodospirillum photometricum]CCG07900.1 Intracellular septation protein A [Pararhodospirillum photometricum DSM 122]